MIPLLQEVNGYFQPRHSKMKFSIGTKFIPRGLDSIHEVIDYHITSNSNGEVVKERYVANHVFMGQEIKTSDIVETTIARGLLPPCHQESSRHKDWIARVEQLEGEGLGRSDAQGIADMEFQITEK
jgi:hypothetical protein